MLALLKDTSTKNGRILAAPFQNTVANGDFKNGNKSVNDIKKSLDFRTFTFKPLDKAGNVRMNTYCGPTTESNWVIPGVLLVGAYPATEDDAETFELITSILKLGIRKFVCLQLEYKANVTPDMWRYGKSLRPYFEDVKQIVENKNSYFQLANNSVPVVDSANLSFEHCPIVDCGITDDDRVLDLCRKLVEDISRGEIIYLHCWGGHGRTGTVVSIMLHLMYGMSASESMARCQLAHDLRVCPVNVGSPQTQTQRDQVTRIIAGLEAEYRRQKQADLGSLLTSNTEQGTGGLIGLPICSVGFSPATVSEKKEYVYIPSEHHKISTPGHHKIGTPVEHHMLHVTLQDTGIKGLIGANGKDHMYTLAVNGSPHASVFTQNNSNNSSRNNSNESSSGENSPHSPSTFPSGIMNNVVQSTVREHGAIPPPLPMVRRGPTSMFASGNLATTPNASQKVAQTPPPLTQQQMNFAALIGSDSGLTQPEITPRGGATTPTLRYEGPTFGASDDSLATITNSAKTSPDLGSSNKFSGSGFNLMQSRDSPFENLSRENSGSNHGSNKSQPSPSRGGGGGADSPLPSIHSSGGLQTSSSDYGYGLYEQAHALEALRVASSSPVLSPIALPNHYSEQDDNDGGTTNSQRQTPRLSDDMDVDADNSTERLSAASLLFFDQAHHYQSRSRPMSINQDSETDNAYTGFGLSSGATSGNNSNNTVSNHNSNNNSQYVSSGISNGIAGKPPIGGSISNGPTPINTPHVRLVVNTSDPHRRRDEAGNDSDGEASSQHVRKATNTNSTPTFVTRPPQHTNSGGSTISQVLNVARQVLSGRSPSSSRNSTPTNKSSSPAPWIVPTPPTSNAPSAQRNSTQRKIDSTNKG